MVDRIYYGICAASPNATGGGGTGGFPQTIRCPSEYVGVGVQGTFICQTAHLVSLALICGHTTNLTQITTTASVGNPPGDATYSYTCPPGMAIFGFSGIIDPMLKNIQILCGKFCVLYITSQNNSIMVNENPCL